MEILFVHPNQPDYLAESLFHGLRKLLGSSCVDVPRYDSMYSPLSEGLRAKQRGNAFTLYGLLDDLPELADKRFYWRADLSRYDLIVIGNIWFQWQLFSEIAQIVEPGKLVLLDGSDLPAFFPYSSFYWRLRKCPWSYFTPVRRHKYFKRELVGGSSSYGLDRFSPLNLDKWTALPKNAMPISFSIPEEKIVRVDREAKTKRFPVHIVDREVAAHLGDAFFSAIGSDRHVFTSEEEYYRDLRCSRFGITTKRAGWDCLRHYELAANGCVLCFKDLDLKPETCAPHGLNESNCIIYHTYSELEEKINSMSDEEYDELQIKTYEWIGCNTTVVSAKEFLVAALS